MRILIIGGTRFLGRAIALTLLPRGHTVTVLHRGQTRCALPQAVREICCDARDPAALEPHFAENRYDAVIDTILSAKDLEWYLPLVHRHCGQLLHCGSTGVYAPLSRAPAREDDPTPCPPELGGFGEKLRQDNVLLDYHRKTGFRVCSLRPSNIFGAGDVPLDGWGSRNPAYFQRMADGAEIWIPNDGRALLQPVHVDDVAEAFGLALESNKVSGQIYNVSSAGAVTLTHYAELACELLGSSPPFRYVPMNDILATGMADESGLRFVNESGLRFVCEHMSIDITKARTDLGYTPRMDVREGLRDSLIWMAQQNILHAKIGK
ncbi:MAG: NAD-dependent epimerase/dehydratase family protein [Candidatus Hydrogenedentes bacterium]|nr:NAD-dependent epimerase/dehydratase family protein [Candidatus Hydrogenedentota bacterium]